MLIRHLVTLAISSFSLHAFVEAAATPKCRNQPGDPGFPSQAQWSQLNAQIGGRLVAVVPSAKYCHSLPSGMCTQDQWLSGTFRATIPGAMQNYNWEQDYLSQPPSLCLQNGTTCGQGNVPLYAINVSSVADIQAGLKFAVKYNLKVAIKASGHDFLGRSTAKNSLLIWTYNLRNFSFTEHFVVAGRDYGSAVTVGSGLPLKEIYEAAKAEEKMIVGGSAPTVVAAGGYVQGGGHSAFSPSLGLGADNVLEYHVVTANGDYVTANEAEHTDLFWAMRGGGGGTWGVIVSATFRTYPIFNATLHTVSISTTTTEATGQLITLHARHIFDWDSFRAGQYFELTSSEAGNTLQVETFFANRSAEEAAAAMKPFLDDVRSMNFTISAETSITEVANDLVSSDSDQFGINTVPVMGSRLIPADAYRSNPDGMGSGYVQMLNLGYKFFGGTLLGGGQVAENADIDSAITPKWRTAKTHILVTDFWNDSTPVSVIEEIKQKVTFKLVPVLANMTLENDSGAYLNEADIREPDFQTTFFGGEARYQRLLAIKKVYDPLGLFIVGAGVGSEDWDVAGLCRI